MKGGQYRQPEPKRPINHLLKEMTMNAFVTALYRDLTCAAAAAVITLVIGMSFVQSTAVGPGMQAPAAATQASRHA